MCAAAVLPSIVTISCYPLLRSMNSIILWTTSGHSLHTQLDYTVNTLCLQPYRLDTAEPLAATIGKTDEQE